MAAVVVARARARVCVELTVDAMHNEPSRSIQFDQSFRIGLEAACAPSLPASDGGAGSGPRAILTTDPVD